MSKTIQIKAFEFPELSDAAKEKARQWWRESAHEDTFWSECPIDEFVEQAELMGVEIKTRERKWTNIKTGKSGVTHENCIYWSGFASQGDGACFEGTWRASEVKADKVAVGWGEAQATTEIKRIAAEFERIAKAYPDASFTVTHSGHYYHQYCTQFDVSLGEALDDLEGIDQEGWSKVEDALIEVARDLMQWLYAQLEKEWEYQNSDECVDENIEGNGYLFTEDGKRTVVL